MKRLLAGADPNATFGPDAFTAFASGLVEQDGCLVLASPKAQSGRVGFENRTAFEASVNTVTYWDDNPTPEHLAAWVLKAHEMCEQLLFNYPMSATAEVVSTLNPAGKQPTAGTRFYLLRDDEDPWILEDLEGYSDEGVAVTAVVVGSGFGL